MIINIFAPAADRKFVEQQQGPEFNILSTYYYSSEGSDILFIVDTVPEIMSYFTLKYGKENIYIWIR